MVVRCLMVLIANAREARCLMVVMTMLTILFLFSQCCYSVCSFGGEPSTLGERILQEHRGYLLLALFGASLTKTREQRSNQEVLWTMPVYKAENQNSRHTGSTRCSCNVITSGTLNAPLHGTNQKVGHASTNEIT